MVAKHLNLAYTKQKKKVVRGYCDVNLYIAWKDLLIIN